MNRFFILGNHKELSVAELTARFNFKKIKQLDDVLLGQLEIGDARETLRTLGGTIKIGRLINRVQKKELYELMLAELEAAEKTSKFNFGISLYGKSSLNTHKLGLELKSELKNKGVSCRFVTSREKTLSSVVVEQNKLVSGGRELVIIPEGDRFVFGVTEAVQPFKELSKRDYGRPGRDDFSGMLPPKLAQIMINLSRADKREILLDPFCGSGTITTEALLMGYTKLAASDISKKALEDTKQNMEWISKRYDLRYDLRLSLTDAKTLSKDFAVSSVGGIVTETYLGPQRGVIDFKKVTGELKTLYSAVLEECLKVLKPGGRVVMALPLFVNKFHVDPRLPASCKKIASYVYGRSGQKVWREIIVLQK